MDQNIPPQPTPMEPPASRPVPSRLAEKHPKFAKFVEKQRANNFANATRVNGDASQFLNLFSAFMGPEVGQRIAGLLSGNADPAGLAGTSWQQTPVASFFQAFQGQDQNNLINQFQQALLGKRPTSPRVNPGVGLNTPNDGGSGTILGG